MYLLSTPAYIAAKGSLAFHHVWQKKVERASLVKVIAIRVLNMPTEDWQLVSLGSSHATLLNLDLCSVTTASFSCMLYLLVRGLGMACNIGWRSLFAAWYDGNCLQSRSSSNSVLM